MKTVVEQFIDACADKDLTNVAIAGFHAGVCSYLMQIDKFYITHLYVTPYINPDDPDMRGYEIEMHTAGWIIELIFSTSFSRMGELRTVVECGVITPDDEKKNTGIKTLTTTDSSINFLIYDVGRPLKFSPCYYTQEYNAIYKHYRGKTTNRSAVPLINHINEGIYILTYMNAALYAKLAYAVHPLFQNDDDLYSAISKFLYEDFNRDVIVLTMEYRNIANQYLSHRKIDSVSDIRLSPIKMVNDMLVADKVQNYADFLKYHKDTHPRSKELDQYFNNWINRLECRAVLDWFLNVKEVSV